MKLEFVVADQKLEFTRGGRSEAECFQDALNDPDLASWVLGIARSSFEYCGEPRPKKYYVSRTVTYVAEAEACDPKQAITKSHGLFPSARRSEAEARDAKRVG